MPPGPELAGRYREVGHLKIPRQVNAEPFGDALSNGRIAREITVNLKNQIIDISYLIRLFILNYLNYFII